MDPPLGEESNSGAAASGSAPSPQSEAVTNELQELSLQATPSLLPLQERKNVETVIMLDTNPGLRIDSAPLRAPPISGDLEKRGVLLDYERHVCHSLREVLQLKLQQRRTREELVSQGIMPPLKSPAAFHEQRKSLERARTEDYLKRKIRNRPDRSELVRMHILEETSAEPSLQARQLQLKRARLADDLNDKISQRPGPMELIHKNILPIHCSLKQALLDFPKGTGENSSFDEDSSDALSPDQPTSQDSPLGQAPLPSPPDTLSHSNDPSPTQSLSQAPPPLALTPALPVPQKLTNGTASQAVTKTAPAPSLVKLSQSKTSTDRPTQRSKKPKDSKPKVKKLKYHQYIPPDQKVEREPPPQLDSTYAKILHQQQLFLQLQIINQQQQHYNYHTILPAPPKPPADQQSPSNTGPSPSRGGATSTSTAANQNGPNRQNLPPVPIFKPGALPSNLDDFKVAELKHELKIRGLPVSGTKNDLLERLRNFQEHNGGTAAVGATPKSSSPQQSSQPVGPSHVLGGTTLLHKPGEGGLVVAAFPFVATVGGGGPQTAAPPAVVQFSSTGSSPPVSPTPSDRSLVGMSADETSCNGDLFGEAVSSPLTQLSLYPSSQQQSVVKEETNGLASSCCFSQSGLQSTDALNKDQMLQEKDKQIEELMRMLQQKQRLVESLRSQLEQGKRRESDFPEVFSVKVKEEPLETPAESSCCSYCPLTLDLAEKEAIRVIIKEETEEELEEMVPELTHFDRGTDLPETQLQVEVPQLQLAQTQQPVELPMELPQHQVSEMQQTVELPQHQLLLTRQKQKSEVRLLREQPVQLQQLQEMLSKQNGQKGPSQQQQKKKKSQKQEQKRELQAQPKQQQVSPVFINQQQNTSVPTSSFSLDLLKTHPTPTLLTDSNGNHFLVALSSRSGEGQGSAAPQRREPRNVKLQRVQSTPAKTPNRSSPQPQVASRDPQSMPQLLHGSSHRKKVQKAKLQVSTKHFQEASKSRVRSAPPNLQPFFVSDNPSPTGNTGSSSPTHMSLTQTPIRSGLDQHTLFRAPSPVSKEKVPPSIEQDKDNRSNQQMDDLFDILIQSGEISASFQGEPEVSGLRPNTPVPSPSPSPLQFSPPTPQEPVPSQQPSGSDLQLPVSVEQEGSSTGSGRLEDFLESTTGKPLLGAEPGAPLTLIDDLHSQMLSTSSILDHPPSPMDTCELTFTSQPPVLDFGDPALDGMEWLDITMGSGGSGLSSALPSASSHGTSSVFSTDFLDSSDLQLHWDSCL